MLIVVKYLETNDALGKFRYWTYDMEVVGQFRHADSKAEIKAKVLEAITVALLDAEAET